MDAHPFSPQEIRSGGRLSDEVEAALVRAILDGHYPPDSQLPLERELAVALGVGRPTLREALQRLSRDGWLSIQKGRGTFVNDYWKTGNLNILATMFQAHAAIPPELVRWVLELRIAVTPVCVQQAVARNPARFVAILVAHQDLEDTAAAYAAFDIQWQRDVAALAPNPLFALLNRSFLDVGTDLFRLYFTSPENRADSRSFYGTLLQAGMDADAAQAAEVTQAAMTAGLSNWHTQSSGGSDHAR
ncbi:MAG: GntR family negative regulator for fad regulon and positive regulator of fabA [Myxococcota bacterium]|jgi:GntR family negative regulator for fad regulon and positive regulator of fabA